MLVGRMKIRGDNEKTIVERKKLITKDIADLNRNKQLVRSCGEFFVIEDDNVIHNEIVPWIENRLGLNWCLQTQV